VSGWRLHNPIDDVGAREYERRFDFPARDPAAAGRYDRGASGGRQLMARRPPQRAMSSLRLHFERDTTS